MRIISGTFKGRSILVPKNFKGRPTTDFAREGLFNMLGHMVEWNGTRVLDLFAGTGAFGLECLSRGAQSLTCVEMQSLHVKFINDNFRLFEMEEASAIKLDVFKFLLQPGQKFDLIFADPPYDLPGIQSIPEKILNSGALEESGILIVEHGKRINFSEMPQFTQMRSFSNVCFSFFELKK